VHIHSYRQDEILMFARLSAALGFQVAAFQHVLEGYKVADALAEVGAGASTFADWWGFKMEVSTRSRTTRAHASRRAWSPR
jgi:hypothetical protein